MFLTFDEGAFAELEEYHPVTQDGVRKLILFPDTTLSLDLNIRRCPDLQKM